MTTKPDRSGGDAQRQPSQRAPFSHSVLKYQDENKEDVSQPNTAHFLANLPAAVHTKQGDLLPLGLDDTFDLIRDEFDVSRLTFILRWLYMAGRPLPPRPLHQQRFLDRDIYITNRMDMHLIWKKGRIFVKPMPRFLLEPQFWIDNLSCVEDCGCLVNTRQCERRQLWSVGLGFLYSYAALVPSESDFLLATESHLIPTGVEWSDWRILVGQILNRHGLYQDIHRRFIYGELKLSHLNIIAIIDHGNILRGYMPANIGRWFLDFFSLLTVATVYIAIVLTAMQVGLATKPLADNDTFQSASYGFAVFSILAPLVLIGLVCGFYVLLFSFDLIWGFLQTQRFLKRRLDRMGISDRI